MPVRERAKIAHFVNFYNANALGVMNTKLTAYNIRLSSTLVSDVLRYATLLFNLVVKAFRMHIVRDARLSHHCADDLLERARFDEM
jgi:hypothetical protein